MKNSANGGWHNNENQDNKRLAPLEKGVYKGCNLFQHIQPKMILFQMEWIYENILNEQKRNGTDEK